MRGDRGGGNEGWGGRAAKGAKGVPGGAGEGSEGQARVLGVCGAAVVWVLGGRGAVQGCCVWDIARGGVRERLWCRQKRGCQEAGYRGAG